MNFCTLALTVMDKPRGYRIDPHHRYTIPALTETAADVGYVCVRQQLDGLQAFILSLLFTSGSKAGDTPCERSSTTSALRYSVFTSSVLHFCGQLLYERRHPAD
ncbi:unnamed protein product, partial [Scytosiphon promiscuus]